MNNVIDDTTFVNASTYVSCGMAVIPLLPNSKIPSGYGPMAGIPKLAQAIVSQKGVDKWFRSDRLKGWNIGIATGITVMVLDLDVKGKNNGVEILNEWVAQFGNLPTTPTVTTPSGGIHYYFKFDDRLRNCPLPNFGMDIKTGTADKFGGHVVAPPSLVNDQPYQWQISLTDATIVAMPEWLVLKLIECGAGCTIESDHASNDAELRYQWKDIAEMLHHIDMEDDWFRKMASFHYTCVNSEIPLKEAYVAFDEHCKQYSGYDQARNWSSWSGLDRSYNGKPVKVATFVKFATDGGWLPAKTKEMMDKMNQECAVIAIGNTMRILVETAHSYMLLSRKDASLYFANRVDEVTEGDKTRRIPQFETWIRSANRREYSSLGMYPGSDAPQGCYNTWKGFDVEPKPGKWPWIHDLILNTICNGNKEHYEWILDWCASLFQHPERVNGTCVVMMGEEGTGKGMFANNLLGKLCKSHYGHLTNSHHLTTNFNAIMADKVLIFADEVYWGGNRKNSGVLKAIVSEGEITIERKGIDSYNSRNYAKFILATNEDWAIPAGTSSRRWMVLDVNSNRKGDANYFNALVAEIEGDGSAAFLHSMLHRSITCNLRVAPITEILAEQRELTSDSITQFVITLFDLGIPMFGATKLDNGGWSIPKAAFYKAYLEWCNSFNYFNPVKENWVTKIMKKRGIVKSKTATHYENIKAISESKNIPGRPNLWKFAPLAIGRRALSDLGLLANVPAIGEGDDVDSDWSWDQIPNSEF